MKKRNKLEFVVVLSMLTALAALVLWEMAKTAVGFTR